MLRPIKNFLTYLQKNATGATIFGVSSNEVNEEDEMNPPLIVEDENQLAEVVGSDDLSPSSTSLPLLKSHDQNENEVVEVPNDMEEQDFDNPSESQEKVFIDLSSSNDSSFEPVLVVSDSDLKESYNSDPLVDPLAIDENYPLDVPITCLSSKCDDEYELLYSIDVVIPMNSEYIQQQQDEESAFNETTSTIRIDDICEEQEIRSEGSDSGLGSETTTNSVDANSSTTTVDSPNNAKIPSRSNLKRRGDVINSQKEKKPKRSINFDGVKVYYFPRIQGFGCVPSQGGCTLGMGARHISWRSFTMAEHVAEQRRAHRQQMNEINPRASSSDESDSEDEITEASGSDLDADTNGFLQPVHAKQRRVILKAAGVRKIDSTEKDDCRAIRNSREFCGCSCRGFCDPDTCACSQAGIKCQVDRQNFPCGCTHEGCGNVVGRVEFNPARVRTHYIHTKMRLGLEQRSEKGLDQLASNIGPESLSAYANNGQQMENNPLAGCNNMNNYSIGINNIDNRSANYLSAQNMHSTMHQNNYNHNLYSNVMHNGHHQLAPPNIPSLIHNNVECGMMSSHDNLYSNENSLGNNLIINNSTKSLHYPYIDMSTSAVETPVNNHLLDYSTPASTSKMYMPYDVEQTNSYMENRYLPSVSNTYSTNAYANYPNSIPYVNYSSTNGLEINRYNNTMQHHTTQHTTNSIINFNPLNNLEAPSTSLQKLPTVVNTTAVPENKPISSYQSESSNINEIIKDEPHNELYFQAPDLKNTESFDCKNNQGVQENNVAIAVDTSTSAQTDSPLSALEQPTTVTESVQETIGSLQSLKSKNTTLPEQISTLCDENKSLVSETHDDPTLKSNFLKLANNDGIDSNFNECKSSLLTADSEA